MRLGTWLLPCIAVTCVACASGGGAPGHSGVLNAAKLTKPGGTCVIEVDASGAFVGGESQIDVKSVPEAIRAAAEKAAPGGSVLGAERGTAADGRMFWQIDKKIDGLEREIVLDDAGSVVGGENQIAQKDWPGWVVEAANKAVRDGRVTTIELVWGPEALGATEYHVKKDVGGEVVRISVQDGGRIGRVVRKIRAEVKAPR